MLPDNRPTVLPPRNVRLPPADPATLPANGYRRQSPGWRGAPRLPRRPVRRKEEHWRKIPCWAMAPGRWEQRRRRRTPQPRAPPATPRPSAAATRSRLIGPSATSQRFARTQRPRARWAPVRLRERALPAPPVRAVPPATRHRPAAARRHLPTGQYRSAPRRRDRAPHPASRRTRKRRQRTASSSKADLSARDRGSSPDKRSRLETARGIAESGGSQHWWRRSREYAMAAPPATRPPPRAIRRSADRRPRRSPATRAADAPPSPMSRIAMVPAPRPECAADRREPRR